MSREEAAAVKATMDDRISSLHDLPDDQADRRLLPGWMAGADNSRKLRHYKRALRKALLTSATPEQREMIRLFYKEGLRKTQIAQMRKCSCSWVAKCILAGEQAVRDYIDLYMEIYDSLEREILSEDE